MKNSEKITAEINSILEHNNEIGHDIKMLKLTEDEPSKTIVYLKALINRNNLMIGSLERLIATPD